MAAMESSALARSDKPIVYAGHAFRTLEDVEAYISSVDPADRYGTQTAILETMVTYHEGAGDLIEKMFAYVKTNGAYRSHVSEEEFEVTWAGVKVIVKNNEKRRNRLIEAKAAVLKCWSTTRAVAWVNSTSFSANFLGEVRQFARVCQDWEEATSRINHAMVQRLEQRRRGVSTAKVVISGDVEKARKGNAAGNIPAAKIAELGLRIGPYGLLQEEDGSLVTELEDDGGSSSRPEENRVGGSGAPEENMAVDFERAETPEGSAEFADTPAGNTTSYIGTPGSEDITDFPRPAGEIPGAYRTSRINTTLTVEEAAEYQISGAQLDEGAIDDAEEELRGGQVEEVAVGDEAAERDTDDEDDEDDEDRRPAKRRRVDGCTCSSDVSSGWKKAVMTKRMLGLTADMKLLAKHQSFRHVCYAHSKAMGSHIGLMLKTLNGRNLAARLTAVHENRLSLGTLKTDPQTYQWFRVTNRPPRPSDDLGPYKFAPVAQDSAFTYDQSTVLSRISGDLGESWARDGTVNISLFAWWFQCAIGKIILAEFDMYRHHLREINGKSNFGWLRSMFYGIGQQLMRQDPAYYMLYAALRPDKQWRLVTYPYYAKYAVKGDQTHFRHLDLNIPELVANARGASMIQGSVSLDDEDETNCTVLIPGMQHKLAEWWARCEARGQATDGFVHRITDAMFTKEDAKALGVDWAKVPCAKGDVRVTLPHLPHGADGPSTGTRRTMLPWFVGVQDDQETLEVVEGGTWSELSQAHRDLVSPKATPSGLANRYGAIPYRFPAAVEISGLGPLSDALVCRRRWDSPAVLRDRDLLLGNDTDAIHRYVQKWRVRAVKAAIDAFELVKDEERRVFQEKSFFYHKARFDNHGIPMPEVQPDVDELDEEEVAKDKTVVLEFAEQGDEEQEAEE